jgi:predicted acylesterase/phospholipase RssA
MSELWAATEGHARDVDLVFEGGGLKGIALVDAYSVLEERGYKPQNIAGTSAGAIVAALLDVCCQVYAHNSLILP